MMDDAVQVSICCCTYNHKDYIRDALEGFLMQKTDFDFEIIIHDDASTDGTVDILREYQARYPEVIRLLLEVENQYSKNTKIARDILFSEARGKYTALCEGDDFWIYDRKLQKQYDLMERYPEISACYHNALIYSEIRDGIRLNVWDHPSGYIEDEDVICTTKGWYPSASLFMRTEYMREQPVFKVPTGDEGIRNYLACRGRLYYFNRVWSIYREFSSGGWNTRYYHDKEFAEKHFRITMEYFQHFNKYTRGRFEKYIKRRLFRGIDKYRDAHYRKECSKSELKRCLIDLKNVTEHTVDNILDEYYSIYAIRCKDYYKSTIEEQLKRDDELYLYGAGNEAIKALIELDKHHMSPKGFIISDREGAPSKLLGIPVYEAGEFMFDESKRIWPCLIDGREDVLRFLHSKGCEQIVM